MTGVIDVGTSGVGDPACDLVITWTFHDGSARETIRRAVDQDGGTWARARGWVLWKSLLGLTSDGVTDEQRAQEVRIIDAVVAEHAGA